MLIPGSVVPMPVSFEKGRGWSLAMNLNVAAGPMIFFWFDVGEKETFFFFLVHLLFIELVDR